MPRLNPVSFTSGELDQSGAALQNQARTQGLQELLALRNQPLSELNAIRTGAQPQMPQFQPTQYPGQMQGPNLLGAAGAAGNFANQNYANQMGGYNSMMGGLFDLGGAVAGMPRWN